MVMVQMSPWVEFVISRAHPKGRGKEESVLSMYGLGSMTELGPNGLLVVVGEGGSAEAIRAEDVVDEDEQF
jgi:hypothetical protein